MHSTVLNSILAEGRKILVAIIFGAKKLLNSHMLKFMSHPVYENHNFCISCLRVGVVFCGRQSPGGHNVIWGLFEALKVHNPKSVLLGFLGKCSLFVTLVVLPFYSKHFRLGTFLFFMCLRGFLGKCSLFHVFACLKFIELWWIRFGIVICLFESARY